MKKLDRVAKPGKIMRGMAVIDYFAACGGCGAEEWTSEADNTKVMMGRELRRLGWGKRGGLWICVDCIKGSV